MISYRPINLDQTLETYFLFISLFTSPTSFVDWTTEKSEFESRWGQEFSLLQLIQTGPEVHPTSSPMGTGGSFPGGKAAGALS
jgi:hypothetical protein